MMHVLQGDAYTGNWLSAIRHTPKLARRMIVSTMSLVAELYPDKTHVLYGPRHAVIHCNTLPHCYSMQQTSKPIHCITDAVPKTLQRVRCAVLLPGHYCCMHRPSSDSIASQSEQQDLPDLSNEIHKAPASSQSDLAWVDHEPVSALSR